MQSAHYSCARCLIEYLLDKRIVRFHHRWMVFLYSASALNNFGGTVKQFFFDNRRRFDFGSLTIHDLVPISDVGGIINDTLYRAGRPMGFNLTTFLLTDTDKVHHRRINFILVKIISYLSEKFLIIGNHVEYLTNNRHNFFINDKPFPFFIQQIPILFIMYGKIPLRLFSSGATIQHTPDIGVTLFLEICRSFLISQSQTAHVILNYGKMDACR